MQNVELCWSSEKPTKPGWYWWKAQRPDWPPEICLVLNDRGNKLIALFSGDSSHETVQIDEFEHTPLWAGPIPEPTERTEGT
ncbi:MAG: hypothetical protein OJF50_002484 [Nitrospira sp.]|jgi:hypothetical protein|nr:hypothetical protein [Nitrospira sp.]